MVQKPEKGRYLQLEDVRVSYKAKEDTIHLTSSDSDIPNGSFFMTLKKDTPTEQALRTLLEKEGLIRSEKYKNAIKHDIVPSIVMDMLSNKPQFIDVSGRPGSGKTVLSYKIVKAAAMAKIPTLIFDMKTDYVGIDFQVPTRRINITDLPQGYLNPFNIIPQGQELDSLVEDFFREILIGAYSESPTLLFTLKSAIQLAIQEPNADSKTLLRFLLEGDDNDSKKLVENLQLLLRSEIGYLFYGSPKDNEEGLIGKHKNDSAFNLFEDNALTILTFNSLQQPYEAHDETSKLALSRYKSIFNNLYIKLFSELKDNTSPKLIVADSLHQALSSPKKFVVSIYGALKNKNTSMVSVDIKGLDNSLFNSYVTQKMLFAGYYAEDGEERLELSGGQFYWEKVDTGERDLVILSYSREDAAIFDTNPVKAEIETYFK
jgi:hypothetical protein